MTMTTTIQAIWKKIEFKNAIKMAIAALVSLYLGLEFTVWVKRPDPLVSGLWCVVTAMVVLQANLGGTYKAILNRFLGVLTGSLSGAFFASLLGIHEMGIGLAIFSTIVICSALSLQESYRIASLSVAAVMIPWGLHPVISPWTFATFRFLDTCIGLLVAVTIAHMIWPSEAIAKLRSNMVNTLTSLNQLYEAIFFFKDVEEKEKRIQSLITETHALFIQNHSILEESKLESLTPSSLALWTEILEELENLFKALSSLKDIWNQKLQLIFDAALNQHVQDVIKQIHHALEELAIKLQGEEPLKFEVTYMLNSQDQLNTQLVRFRETRATRKFSFYDLEKYFVFFYTLKSIINYLVHLDHLIDALHVANKEAS